MDIVSVKPFDHFTRYYFITAVKSNLPKWKVLINWVCGVEMADTQEEADHQVEQQQQYLKTEKKSPQQMALEAAELLHEPEWKRNIVDANAVLVMAVAMFFWGFYA